jgi:hypothetical protein
VGLSQIYVRGFGLFFMTDFGDVIVLCPDNQTRKMICEHIKKGALTAKCKKKATTKVQRGEANNGSIFLLSLLLKFLVSKRTTKPLVQKLRTSQVPVEHSTKLDDELHYAIELAKHH